MSCMQPHILTHVGLWLYILWSRVHSQVCISAGGCGPPSGPKGGPEGGDCTRTCTCASLTLWQKISFHFYWNSPITAPTLIKEIAVPTGHLKDLHMMVDEKNNNFDVNTDCIWKLVSQRQFFKVMGIYQWQVTPENVYLKSQKQARAELNELSHRYSFHSEGAPFISYQNHRS